MGHENSITRPVKGGRFANFDNAGPNRGKQLGGTFKTEREAVRQAKIRSKNFNPKTGRQTDKFGRKRTVSPVTGGPQAKRTANQVRAVKRAKTTRARKR